MDNNELIAIFDQQATHYDSQWDKIAPVYFGLFFMMEAVFADLPADARILCVGAGTGKELLYLAKKFPGWHFTAVEPAPAMLRVCQHNAQAAGIAGRCDFHGGFLESLPAVPRYDAATCLLVSQFLLSQAERIGFFQQIANKLQPNAPLVNADLSAESKTADYDQLLDIWQRMRSTASPTAEAVMRMKQTYAGKVAILPAIEIAQLIAEAGFSNPVRLFQAGLIQAWFSKRLPG